MNNRGFTFIEIILVVAIIGIIISISGFVNLSNYHGYSFNEERDLLVATLQHARAEAISNICRGGSCADGRSQGVAIRPSDNPNSYVIFQSGISSPDYTNRDSTFDLLITANPNISISGSTINEVVFSKLSGNVTTPGNIILTDTTGRTSTITINSEGQIIWTN